MPAEPHLAVGGEQVARMAVGFAAILRRLGVAVPTGRVWLFVDALDQTGIDERAHVYWAGRATLLQRAEDTARYDEAFATFWLQREPIRRLADSTEPQTVVLDEPDPDTADGATAPPAVAEGPIVAVRWSPLETLRHKDFATYTHAEFDESRRLMSRLRLGGALRRSRRLRVVAGGRRPTRHPDLRHTVHRSLRLGGEPVERRFLTHSRRPRRVVVLCDISGSMEPYSRALLRFLHAAVVARGPARVEAFAFATRLTRLTRELSGHDPDAAIAAAASAVSDWEGGTRLGDVLRQFNDEWGIRGLARGAVIVVCSDGWDRGEPALLAEQMVRLRRVAHRIVWVNPLKHTTGYAPVARGMAAAMPHIDRFVEGHSLASLERLVDVVAEP